MTCQSQGVARQIAESFLANETRRENMQFVVNLLSDLGAYGYHNICAAYALKCKLLQSASAKRK
jgi:hypothetical protein